MAPANDATKPSDRVQTKPLTDGERADLKAIDASLDALFDRKIFNRPDPYIPTIPQDDELVYKHRNAFQAQQFAYNTPFGRDEWENMQYQTYEFADPSDPTSLYKQHVSTWPEKADAPPQPTLKDGAPKKVISLSAYKKQKIMSSPSNGTPSKEKEDRNAVKDPLERTKAESLDILASVEEEGKVGTNSEDVQPTKRKREESEGDAQQGTAKEVSQAEPASKKVRQDDRSPGRDDSSVLPPRRLSPLRMPKQDLPRKLSPTLPDNVELSLTEREQASSKLATRKGGKLTPVNGLSKHKSPVPKNAFRASSESPSIQSDRPQTNAESRKQLLVKLKVNDKQIAAKIRQAAATPAQPKTTGAQPASKSAKGVAVKAQARVEDNTKFEVKDARQDESKPKPGLKRPRQDEDDTASAKKVKANGVRPSTPAKFDTLSPESIKGTPNLRKEAHSTAMQRVLSGDGMAKTPSDVDTPKANAQDIKTPSKPVVVKSAKQKAWETERNRLDALGRSCKHASQAHAAANPSEADLAAVKGLESIINYILAFTCSDEALAAAEPRQAASIKVWMGLSPWYRVAKSHCLRTPLLLGLASLLGMALASHVLDLIVRSAKPFEHDVYNEYLRMLKRSANDLNDNLSLSIVQKSFPQSWQKSKESLEAIKFDLNNVASVPYQLPVGVHTKPVQAAAAARAMLAEWLDTSQLEYRLQK